ncbi:flagellin N-terminal helical domain-containing protein [Candidatus Ponderosibacter sp. Uisw_141_02]|uniref:flagellin N-terminal helical domain-containing protein n=1 Tax=Candidatus Ponderosibacter sp. Uisw_141_02 TaxID=3231000 RepID=UPI003D4F07C3
MSKINTNMAGVTTLYHLRNKEDAMNQALERISSGLRINNAVDDAAGASLVNRMTSQVKGLEAAIRNAADAVSLTQTAEGALDEVSSILHRMRELSVQSANGVYTGQDRQAIQNEVGQLQLELARIAENSTFNAVKMLNGDFTNTSFQIGFQPGDSAILSIENVDPTGLGEYLVGTDQLVNSNSTFFPAGFPSIASSKATLSSKIAETEDLTIYGNVGNATIDINGGATAKDIAAAITARKGETGVYADAQTRMNVAFSELAAGSAKSPDTVSFNLYGKNGTAVLIAANVDFGIASGAGANLSELAGAVNGTSGKTGITASLSIDKSTMTLISDDGYDIVVENYSLVAGTGPSMNISGADENYANLTDSTTKFSDASTDYYSPIELTAGTDPDTVGVTGAIKFHSPFVFSVATASQGTDEAPTVTVTDNTTLGDLTASTTKLIVVPETVGAAVTGNSGASPSPSGMTIEFRTAADGSILTPVRILNMGSGFEYGDTIQINESLLGGTGTDTIDVLLGIPSGKSDGNKIATPGGLFSGNPSGAKLSSVSELDVLNVANSLKMLTAVDGALVRIDLERSDLGATMSRMEHTISNLSNIVMNTKAARSRIADADIALESTELSKAQVLNQAAQAMLAQANKAQQSILQLLN